MGIGRRLFHRVISWNAEGVSITEGVSATYRARYFPIKASLGQSNVSTSTKRFRDVSIERVLLCGQLIYSQPRQTLHDRKGTYYRSVHDVQPDLREIADILEDGNTMMIVLCIDKRPPFSLHLDCLTLLLSLNRFGFNRVFPIKYLLFFIGTPSKFEKGTKELKRLDFNLVYVIWKAHFLVSKKKFTKIREL